ncbi:sensor histidine kinase [Flavobacterium sp. N1736]|uniref:sensor histidine kinase n=1 Tax=Flavobacterium sp. N1736 TaxID=2986823 RepID=UPI002224C24E|nr:ATP-binding protein [Flavobacterium sp. N1736]
MYIFRIILLLVFFSGLNAIPVFSQHASTPKTGLKELKKEIKVNIAPEKNQLLELEKSTNKKIVSLFMVLAITMIVLLYFVYQNDKLKRKNKQKDIQQKIQLNIINAGIDGQENERKKIASFLHDNINSLLSSVGLHLNVFTAQNDIKSEELIKAKSILEDAHDRLRDMSHELIPTLLVRFGLVYALEDLCEKNSNSSLQFDFLSSIATTKRYNEKFEIKLYFVVSELFSNIIKHSEAKKAQISLHEKQNNLIIIIHDNGIGFNCEKLNQEGFGLNRIRARIKKLKGSFAIISRENDNAGTSVKIKVPVL